MNDRDKFGYDKEELWWSWQACAESMQAEIDNLEGCISTMKHIASDREARVKELEEFIKTCADVEGCMINGNRIAEQAKKLLRVVKL